jgi:hypothetical protein
MARTVVITKQGVPGVPGAGGYVPGGTDVAVSDGGTGASSASAARTNLGAAAASDLTSHTGNTSNPHSVTKTQVGLSNVDNTSDANKPVSTAQQSALDAKANLSNFRALKVAPQTLTLTSFENIVGASFSVEANTNYYFTLNISVNSTAGTPTADFQFTGPSSPVSVGIVMKQQASSTSEVRKIFTAFSTAPGASAVVQLSNLLVDGVVEIGANAGTVQMQVQMGGTTPSMTINLGAGFVVRCQ